MVVVVVVMGEEGKKRGLLYCGGVRVRVEKGEQVLE